MTEFRVTSKILTVDDKPQNLYALEKLLSTLDVEILQTTSGFEALELTLEHEFCLAIVDVQMPEMDGYELVELLRGNPDTASLPVIFVSAIYSDEYHHRKGYDAGAVDFMSKPFVPEILISKIKIFIDLYQQRIMLEESVSQLNAKNEALEVEINQRERAEAALRKANTDKDKLFSIISHDLRNPFQILLGNTEWILDQINTLSRTEIEDITRSVHRSAETSYNLLENLLTWSRLQRKRIEYTPNQVELHDLAESTVNLYSEMAIRKKIQLGHTIESGLLAYADKDMIDTVIRNLTANALKFTPENGQVTLSAHRNFVAQDEKEGDWIEVAVQDTGVGISEEDINKLFKIDVHHTTQGTKQESGTGLGLILCQDMVTRNGGEIWIESEPNQGTTVKFIVPANSVENGTNN